MPDAAEVVREAELGQLCDGVYPRAGEVLECLIAGPGGCGRCEAVGRFGEVWGQLVEADREVALAFHRGVARLAGVTADAGPLSWMAELDAVFGDAPDGVVAEMVAQAAQVGLEEWPEAPGDGELSPARR